MKEIYEEEEVEPEKIKGRYTHPKTGLKFNTIEEYKEIEKNYVSEETKTKRQLLKIYFQLKEQKEQII